MMVVYLLLSQPTGEIPMPDSSQYPAVISSNLTVTIANGASISGAADLSGTSFVGYVMPSSWTAADITLQGSVDGNNFFNLYDQFGNEVRHVSAASRFIALNPAELACVRHLKLRSGTSSSAVNQGAERIITLVTRAI